MENRCHEVLRHRDRQRGPACRALEREQKPLARAPGRVHLLQELGHNAVHLPCQTRGPFRIHLLLLLRQLRRQLVEDRDQQDLDKQLLLHCRLQVQLMSPSFLSNHIETAL